MTSLKEMMDLQSQLMTGTFNEEMTAEVMPKFAGFFAGEITWKFGQGDEAKGDLGAMMGGFGSQWYGMKNQSITGTGAAVIDGTGKSFMWMHQFNANLTDATGADVPDTAAVMHGWSNIKFDDEGKINYWHQIWDTAYHNKNKEKIPAADTAPVDTAPADADVAPAAE